MFVTANCNRTGRKILKMVFWRMDGLYGKFDGRFRIGLAGLAVVGLNLANKHDDVGGWIPIA